MHPPPPANDNLKPFIKFLPPYVKIIFYISANLQRIDFTDILILLISDDNTRLKRLEKRENNNQARIQALMNGSLKTNILLKYGLCLKN
ncbi:hypothetical protein [Helicobacter sp. 11-8110]|uniref:hypothetical protein n=2 Tax=unclassified Helicobacter TaxID=2593540 RepID=UPI000DCE2D88|nr:hypothetical protein [Helicobacter sp. 11-8110]RAX51736.1 hypothetical protein CCY98_06875 [Helicobacter sp. 11-8110]